LWKKLSSRGFLGGENREQKKGQREKIGFCSGGMKEKKEESKLRGAAWKCRTKCGR
jgi:hypothetical protein